MEATIMGYIGAILWYIGFYNGYIGIMGKKMETTAMSYIRTTIIRIHSFIPS